MKVLMLNGSAHMNGCTFTALEEIGKTLKSEGIDYEIFQIGAKPVRDCMGCGKCREIGKCVFDDDEVNKFVELAKECDGFVFGTPVYFAHPSGRILSFLDRVFYSSSCGGKYPAFAHKPSTVVASARRGGTTASLDALAKYFTIAQMPLVASTYWNMVHGNTPEQVKEDKEGLQTMRNIAHNMAWLIKSIEAGKQNSVPSPKNEYGEKTNFIR